MITWKLPTPDEPGFLRRRRALSELLDLPPTPENTDKLLDFLAPYVVTVPKGKSAKNILLDASQAEYGTAVMQILGYGNTVTDPKGESSGLQ